MRRAYTRRKDKRNSARRRQIGGGPPSNGAVAGRSSESVQKEWESAVMSGDIGMARNALTRGANPLAKILPEGGSPAYATVAMLNGEPSAQILDLLYSVKVPTPRDYINMLLILPIPEGKIVELLKVAVEHGEDVNATTSDDTPLEIAMDKNYAEATRYLLEAGANYKMLAPFVIDIPTSGFGKDATTVFLDFIKEPTALQAPTKERSFYKMFREQNVERQKVLETAIKKWDENPQPICNTEGTFQHIGECWNDTAQMLFLYTDGIKEYVQPTLLKGRLDALAAIFQDGTPSGYDRAKQMYVYLDSMRSRFARQYLNQHETEEQCAINIESAIRKGYGSYRAKGANAFIGAVMGGNTRYNITGHAAPFHTSKVNYKYGYVPHYIMNDLSRAFGLAPHINLFYTEINRTTNNPYYTHNSIDKIASIQITTRMQLIDGSYEVHSTCFYTCGGSDYYFDDEIGVFQYPWRSFFAKRATLHIFTLRNTETREVITNHFPGFYLIKEKRLIIPTIHSYLNMDKPKYHVLSWDGNTALTKRWYSAGVDYIKSSILSVVEIVYLDHLVPVVPKIRPAIVGRGTYRRPYVSSNISSNRNTLTLSAQEGKYRQTYRMGNILPDADEQ